MTRFSKMTRFSNVLAAGTALVLLSGAFVTEPVMAGGQKVSNGSWSKLKSRPSISQANPSRTAVGIGAAHKKAQPYPSTTRTRLPKIEPSDLRRRAQGYWTTRARDGVEGVANQSISEKLRPRYVIEDNTPTGRKRHMLAK